MDKLLLRASSNGSLGEEMWSLMKIADRENQIEIDVVGDDGLTPLMVAYSKGYLDEARFLKKMGADPLLRGRSGHCALQLALKAGHLNIIHDTADLWMEVGLSSGNKSDFLKCVSILMHFNDIILN